MTIQVLDWAKLPGDLQDARHYREYNPLEVDKGALAHVIAHYGLDVTHDPRHLHGFAAAITEVKSGLREIPTGWLLLIGVNPRVSQIINKYIQVAWANMLTTIGDYVEEYVGTPAVLGEPTPVDMGLPEISPASFNWGCVRPEARFLQMYMVLERNRVALLPSTDKELHAENLSYSRSRQKGRPLYAFSKMLSWKLLSPLMFKLVRDINDSVPPGHWKVPEDSLFAYVSYVSGLMYNCLPTEYRILAEA